MSLEWTIDLNHRKEPLLALDGKYLVISDQNNDVAALVPKDREDVARMIAAAPDLLAALMDLWGFVQDLQKSNPGYIGKLCLQDYARFVKAMGATPAALEKAQDTGEDEDEDDDRETMEDKRLRRAENGHPDA